MVPTQEMQNHMIMKIRVLFYLAIMIMMSCSNSDSPPQVKIILSMEDARIVEGQLLEGIIRTMATDGGVKSVKVYFDDDLVLTFDDPIQELPFQFEVEKTSGQYYLRAEAVDEQGHIGVDEIKLIVEKRVIKPEVSIIAPFGGQNFVVGEKVDLLINSKDEDGFVEKLDIYLDNEKIWSIESPNEEELINYVFKLSDRGKNILRARVSDNDDNVTFEEVEISIVGKNDYLLNWIGTYIGSVDVWSDGFAGSTSSIKDLEMIVSPSSSDSTLNFLIKINDEVIRQQALRVSGEGEHASSWGEVSNSGFLHLTFSNDTLQYRYQQSMGLGRRDGHDGVGYRQ
jgi:hypothetical protein